MSNTLNDVPVQKLANLDQRLERWETERKTYRKELAKGFLFSCFGVGFLLMSGTYIFSGDPAHLELLLKLMALSCLLAIPFCINYLNICHRPRPTQQDVERDIALRKAFNMDSEVKQ